MGALGVRAPRAYRVQQSSRAPSAFRVGAALVSLTRSLLVLGMALAATACHGTTNAFVIALSDNIKTIDPIGSPSVDAASERVRTLMFNSLVKKDDKFDYVPELASSIDRSADGLTYRFTLRDRVTFHDGRPFTAADAKYTLDTLLQSTFAKAASFFEGSGGNRTARVKSVEAPDPRTLIVRLNSPWVGLLPNLVAVAIIPQGSYGQQKDRPLGTGPFKFLHFDEAQQVVDLEANPNYWEGPPHISALRVRVISDANAMQAELRSGRVDIAPLATSLSPDAIESLSREPNLQVKQFPGSNVACLTFNTEQSPLNNVKVRQAIAYAIDRQSMIRDLLLGQAKLAHSILPVESWAYTQGQTYVYNPATARQLLDGAGLPDSNDTSHMRLAKPIVFRISGSSSAARQYAGLIQNYLKDVGLPVSVETSETNTLFELLRRGQFQMSYGQWVGGNQDPIFYKDLFASSEIPTEARASRNRSRYSNPELDAILEQAVNSYDHAKAAPLYARAQEIVSRDLPLFPLWYQANMVIAKKTVGNIHINASGDWGFVKDLTTEPGR